MYTRKRCTRACACARTHAYGGCKVSTRALSHTHSLSLSRSLALSLSPAKTVSLSFALSLLSLTHSLAQEASCVCSNGSSTWQVEIPVEKIVYRDKVVEIPVEKIIEKEVQVPVERIVYKDKIVEVSSHLI